MKTRQQIVLLTFLVMCTGIGAKGQGLFEDPSPGERQATLRVAMAKAAPKSHEMISLPKPVLREPWWKLNKDVTALGTVHGATSLMDGVTTRRWPRGFIEADPVDRLFLGPVPAWSRMIPLGTLEILGTAVLAQRMKRSNRKVFRRLYFAPQILLIGLHSYAAGGNIIKTNASLAEGGTYQLPVFVRQLSPYEIHARVR